MGARRTKRRRLGRRRRKRGRINPEPAKIYLPRRVAAFPPQRMTKTLLYVSDPGTSINAGLAMIDNHIFSCNGVFDPDITGVGHQPKGFDQIMPLYDHYTVLKSRIACTFYPNGTNIFRCGIVVVDSTSEYTNLSQVGEVPTAKSTCVMNGSSADCKTVSVGVFPLKFLGMKFGEDTTRGSASSNPAEGCFFHVYVGSASGADPVAIFFDAKIWYTVVFHEPKILAQS